MNIEQFSIHHPLPEMGVYTPVPKLHYKPAVSERVFCHHEVCHLAELMFTTSKGTFPLNKYRNIEKAKKNNKPFVVVNSVRCQTLFSTDKLNVLKQTDKASILKKFPSVTTKPAKQDRRHTTTTAPSANGITDHNSELNYVLRKPTLLVPHMRTILKCVLWSSKAYPCPFSSSHRHLV